MAKKEHYTVARNAAYTASSIEVRERHNERKNETYYNADIVPERKNLNIHFCQYQFPDGTPVTYEQRFNQLLAAGTIVKRGIKEDAKVIDELIFDVNTAYFEESGGYDFAKRFYAAAYQLAVKEVGSEDYILSAVMHADEKNVGLSEQLGKDVYHYHLHVVYVPVVQKEVLWSKRCKDPALIGTVKEVIPQISHSKKWPKYKDETGKWINEYSLLQDRFYEGMKAAGYDGFERGERGSTAEHLSVEVYKTQQEIKRREAVTAEVEQSEVRLGEMEKQAEKRTTKLEKLDEQITVKEKAKATIKEVDAMGNSLPFVPGVHLSDDEAKRLKALAKKGIGIDKRAEEYKKKIAALDNNIRDLNGHITLLKQDVSSIARDRDTWKANYERLWSEVKDFIVAIRSIPQKLRAFVEEHLPRQRNHHNREEV